MGAAYVRVIVADRRWRGMLRCITQPGPGPRALARGSLHRGQGGSLVPPYTRESVSLSRGSVSFSCSVSQGAGLKPDASTATAAA
jgi:hypothetical protein